MRFATSCLATLLLSTSAFAAPKVIASIVPVHSIVSNVMGDVGAPVLLLSGKNSEHSASVSPRQLTDLGQADVVFMIGAGLEHKLGQISGTEAVKGKKFLALSEVDGVTTLKVREGGTFEAHEDEEEHAGEKHKGEEPEHHEDELMKFDPHVWLDPANTKAMTAAVATELSKIDPEHASVYAANAAAYLAKLDALATEISGETKPLQNKPVIVFHDAYQYFERAFGLTVAGSISDASAATPSAKRIKEIRDKLEETKAICVFREPQFDAKYVNVVLEGSNAKQGVLDPMGYDLTPGPNAYAEILRNIATSAKACLGGG